MALPTPLLTGLLPSEVEYLSVSTTTINIVPLLRIDRVRLLSGVYGPFRPPHQTKVPLWLAINLKRRKKCVLVPPEWLGMESLKALLLRESTNEGFAPVPLHYVAIAKVLLDVAPDDIPSADEVRALLKDLREARQSKVLKGLVALNSMHISMTNISISEVCELRPFFSEAFEHLRALGPKSSADLSSSYAAGGGGAGGTGNLSAYDDSQMTLGEESQDLGMDARRGDTTAQSDSGYLSGVGVGHGRGERGRVADDSTAYDTTGEVGLGSNLQERGQPQQQQQQQAAGFDSMDLF